MSATDKSFRLGQHQLSLQRQRTALSFWVFVEMKKNSPFALCETRPDKGNETTHAYVRTWQVERAWESKGLGSRMIKDMIEWLKAEGFSTLYIDIEDENIYTQRLVRRLGAVKRKEGSVFEYAFDLAKPVLARNKPLPGKAPAPKGKKKRKKK